MSFVKWAIENPTEMVEYERLKDKIQGVRDEIKWHEEKLKDAQNGIAPSFDPYLPPYVQASRKFVDLFHNAKLREIDEILYSSPRIAEQMEELEIARFKKEHDALIHTCVELATWYLHGGEKAGVLKEGLYSILNQLERDLDTFNPLDHIVKWQGNAYNRWESEYDRNIAKAIRQRLCNSTYHYYEEDDNLDQLLDVVSTLDLNIGGLSFELRYLKDGWIARIGRGEVTFTRFSRLSPLFALQRALIVFIDHEWNALIEDE